MITQTEEKKDVLTQLRLTDSQTKQLADLKKQTGIPRPTLLRAALDFYLPRALSGEIPVVIQLGKGSN